MIYSVFLVNSDGSAALIGVFQDQQAALDFANGEPSGSTVRIEYGDGTQSIVLYTIEVP